MSTESAEQARPPHPYIPDGPLDEAPWLGYEPPQTRSEAFAAALEGVALGSYDRRMISWLVSWDDPTARTIASLMWRCRLAGRSNEEKP